MIRAGTLASALAGLAFSMFAQAPPRPDRELTDLARAEGDAWLAVVQGNAPRGIWRKSGEEPWHEALEVDARSALQRVRPGTWRLRTLTGTVISRDDGLTWAGSAAPWLDSVSDDRGHLFHCDGGRLQRSDDAGITWSVVVAWASLTSPTICYATASAGRVVVVGVGPRPPSGGATAVQVLSSTDGGSHWRRRTSYADGALLDALAHHDVSMVDGRGNLLVAREAVDVGADGRLSNRRAWFLLPAMADRWRAVERALQAGELLSAVGGDAYGLHVQCAWKADKTFSSDLCLLAPGGGIRLEASISGQSGLAFRTLPGGEVLPVPTIVNLAATRRSGASQFSWFDRRDKQWHVLSTQGLPDFVR